MPQEIKKSALVTGASSGIGTALSLSLAREGFHVFLVARRQQRLEKIHDEILDFGGECTIISADLSQKSERERLYQEVTSAPIHIDVLVNNAGFGWYGYFSEMPWSIAEEMISVNIESVAHLTSLFLADMIKRSCGHVINIGSIAGGLPNQGIAVYAGSKAFLDAYSTALFRETRGSGVSVSVMRLGPVKTEFFDQARSLKNGYSVPAERFAISTVRVEQAFKRLLKRPRRAVYVPRWLWISQFVEAVFAPIIDLLGPLLLKHKKN